MRINSPVSFKGGVFVSGNSFSTREAIFGADQAIQDVFERKSEEINACWISSFKHISDGSVGCFAHYTELDSPSNTEQIESEIEKQLKAMVSSNDIIIRIPDMTHVRFKQACNKLGAIARSASGMTRERFLEVLAPFIRK